MGDAGITVAVADAGPVIHLNEIACLSLLQVLDAVAIPDAVWSEVCQPGRVPEEDLLALGNVRRELVPPDELARFVDEHDLHHVHPAEREALLLCQRISAPLILTDDLAVREAANRFSVTPVGSLGIVVRAYRAGRLSLDDAEQSLLALYETSTLYVTRAIVEMAVEQLRR